MLWAKKKPAKASPCFSPFLAALSAFAVWTGFYIALLRKSPPAPFWAAAFPAGSRIFRLRLGKPRNRGIFYNPICYYTRLAAPFLAPRSVFLHVSSVIAFVSRFPFHALQLAPCFLTSKAAVFLVRACCFKFCPANRAFY